MKWHGYLSIFFLPLALLYVVSGSLYLWADLDTQVKEKVTLYGLEPDAPVEADLVRALLKRELAARGYSIPQDELKQDDEGEYVWRTNRSYRVVYRPSSSTKGKAYITVYNSTLYGRLLNFHKGKGSDLFDILGTSFAVLLIFSYLSGVYLAFKIPAMRKWSVMSFLLGLSVVVWALYAL